MIRHQRRRKARLFKDAYPEQPRGGDLVVDNVLGELYRANTWIRDGVFQVGYRKVKPPEKDMIPKLIENEIYWAKPKHCVRCGRDYK